jgi:hypothetical protein
MFVSVTLAKVIDAELVPVKELADVVLRDKVLALKKPVVLPPSNEGLVTELICVNDTQAAPDVAEAEPIVGAVGTDTGRTEVLAEEATEVPLAFVAVIVYVLYVPTVSEIVNGEVVPVAVKPLEDVTVYPVIAVPPVAPAVNCIDTVDDPAEYAWAEATVGVPIVGF